MRGLPLSRLPNGFGGGMRRRPNQRCRSTASSAGSSSSQTSLNAYTKAGITCGALSTAGDLLAQALTRRHARKHGMPGHDLDLVRTARMASFGLLFYGPLQHRWYGLLASRFPGTSTPNFLSKVALNQFALGPVVLAASFAWNLVLTRHADKYFSKLRHDGPPSMVNGWKFWVPASCINFWLVPLRNQVLYMSTCGMLWSSYLSYASNS